MENASVHLRPGTDVPVYRQIIDQVRAHIETGTLPPGTPLPSVRSLATQLGVHFNTAADAYRELAAEGWIDVQQGRRAVVRSPRIAPALARQEAETLRVRLQTLVAEMLQRGISSTLIANDVRTLLER